MSGILIALDLDLLSVINDFHARKIGRDIDPVTLLPFRGHRHLGRRQEECQQERAFLYTRCHNILHLVQLSFKVPNNGMPVLRLKQEPDHRTRRLL